MGRSPREGNGSPFQYSLPGESHGLRSLAGYSPWGCKELDTTEHFRFHFFPSPGASFHLPPHLELSPPPSPPTFTHDYKSYHSPSEKPPMFMAGPKQASPSLLAALGKISLSTSISVSAHSLSSCKSHRHRCATENT